MSRPLRIEYEGAWYHVYNRGGSGKDIFLDNYDYHLFFDLLNDIFTLWNVQTHAFSLMPNHYHLLIHTPNSQLSRAMRHLNGVYTQRFNRHHKKDGHLFKGRFKAKIIEKDNYLLQLARYIHLNPVKSGIVKNPKHHRWTSHVEYLEPRKRHEWLFTNEVLAYFSKKPAIATKKFDKFVSEGVPEDIDKQLESKKWIGVLGSDSFQDWIKSNFIAVGEDSAEIPEIRDLRRKQVKVEDIIKSISDFYDISEQRILKKRYRTEQNEARMIAIYMIRKLVGCSYFEIAKRFTGMSVAAVAKSIQRFNERVIKDNGLRKRADTLNKNSLSLVKT